MRGNRLLVYSITEPFRNDSDLCFLLICCYTTGISLSLAQPFSSPCITTFRNYLLIPTRASPIQENRENRKSLPPPIYMRAQRRKLRQRWSPLARRLRHGPIGSSLGFSSATYSAQRLYHLPPDNQSHDLPMVQCWSLQSRPVLPSFSIFMPP